MATSDQLAQLIDDGAVDAAWTEFHRLLDAFEKMLHGESMTEAGAGRAKTSRRPDVADPSGCAGRLLWHFTRHAIAQPRRHLASAWCELVARETLWDDAFSRPGKYPGTDSPDFTLADSAACLVRGGFAAARAAVAATAEAHCIDLTPTEQSQLSISYQFARTLWLEFVKAGRAYAEFWLGQTLSDDVVNIAQHFGPLDIASPPAPVAPSELLVKIRDRAAQMWVFSASDPNEHTALRIGFSMAMRAIEWLIDCLEVEPPGDSRYLWILLAGKETGTCARLVVTLERNPRPKPLAYPDPIDLGILPLDRAWRQSFDAATAWSNQFRQHDDPHTAFRWHLEFLNSDQANALRREGVETHPRDLQRPPCLKGPSASAAFAALLSAAIRGEPIDTQITVTAQVTTAGELEPVGDLPKKFDPVLWKHFLRPRLRHVVICGRDSEFYLKWNEALGRYISSNDDTFIQTAAAMESVRHFCTRRRKAVAACAKAQLNLAAARLRHIRPRRFEEAIAKEDLALFVALHVPARVRIAKSVSPDSHASEQSSSRPVENGRIANSIRLEASPNSRVGDGANPNGPSRTAEFANEFDCWLQHSRKGALVVTGGPGMGKTWLGLHTVAKLYERLLAPQSGNSYLPLWLTCRDLPTDSATALPRDILRMFHDHVRRHALLSDCEYDELTAGIDSCVNAALDGGRMLLVVDGWDERPPHADALDRWLASAIRLGIRIVLFSRPEAVDALPILRGKIASLSGEQEHMPWRLAALDDNTCDQMSLFVQHWFGGDAVGLARGRALLDQIPARSRVREALCTPLLASTVCWLWENPVWLRQLLHVSHRPHDPLMLPDSESELMTLVIRCLLAWRRHNTDDPFSIDLLEDRRLLFFAEEAFRAYIGGPWTIPATRFRTTRQHDGPVVHPRSDDDFGLFHYNEAADGFEIVHRAFAEWFVALYITHLAHQWSPECFRDWLIAHLGVRFYDPRWRYVFQFAFGILPAPHSEVFIQWLETIDADQPIRYGDRCGRVIYSTAGPIYPQYAPLVREARAADRWVSLLQSASDDDTLLKALFYLEQMGSLAAPAAQHIYAIVTGDKCARIRTAAAATLVAIGTAALRFVPELVSILDTSTSNDDKAIIVRILGHFQLAADIVVPTLLDLLKRGCGLGSALSSALKETLALLGQAAGPAIPVLVSLLRGMAGDHAADVAMSTLHSLGPPASAALHDIVECLRTSSSDTAAYRARLAASTIKNFGESAAPALDDLIAIIREHYPESVKRNAMHALAGLTTSAIELSPDILAVLVGNYEWNTKCAAAQLLGTWHHHSDAIVPQLVAVLQTNQLADTRRASLIALRELGSTAVPAVPTMLWLIGQDIDETTTRYVVDSLGALGALAEMAIPSLLALLETTNVEQTKQSVLRAIEGIGSDSSETTRRVAKALLVTYDDVTKRCAVNVIQGIGPVALEAVPVLIRVLLLSDDNDVIREVAKALGVFGSASAEAVPHVVSGLRYVTDSSDKMVMAEALVRIATARHEGVFVVMETTNHLYAKVSFMPRPLAAALADALEVVSLP